MKRYHFYSERRNLIRKLSKTRFQQRIALMKAYFMLRKYMSEEARNYYHKLIMGTLPNPYKVCTKR